jgi:hypothetical protein
VHAFLEAGGQVVTHDLSDLRHSRAPLLRQ